MSQPTQLDKALALVLKLPAGARLRLVERVVASVERDIADGVPVMETPAEHWGQALIRLMDTLDLSDWEALKIDDPVEWVKTCAEKVIHVWTLIGMVLDEPLVMSLH